MFRFPVTYRLVVDLLVPAPCLVSLFHTVLWSIYWYQLHVWFPCFIPSCGRSTGISSMSGFPVSYRLVVDLLVPAPCLVSLFHTVLWSIYWYQLHVWFHCDIPSCGRSTGISTMSGFPVTYRLVVDLLVSAPCLVFL
ncbi:hypothetical protein BaRGS_00029223 [Batillaria attramentaria]|uniref:Uncharacterized protein n=1 Tax=Batillaria attramentaria TaxID=370345 RepID=A0ABD0JXZ4_9CAEN